MDKRDRLEDIFRERLYNTEVQPDTSAWEGISARVSRRSSYRVWSHRVAAAVALLLVLGSSVLLLRNHLEEPDLNKPTISLALQVSPVPNGEGRTVSLATEVKDMPLASVYKTREYRIEKNASVPVIEIGIPPVLHELLPGEIKEEMTLVTRERLAPTARRKWKFGVGGGSLGLAGLSLNNMNDMPVYDANNPGMYDPEPGQEPLLSRATAHPEYLPETQNQVKHRTPLSFGVALSYPISKRWSFQTGLTYTYLRSKWTSSTGQTAQKQSLHLVGIPLSLNYRLTDWVRPYCYFSAGVLGEINVTGQLSNKYGKTRIRIPGILWSANARIGIAYPLFRYVSGYAEGGICYYFDYQGTIETMRSGQAFNFTGQIGLRLNF